MLVVSRKWNLLPGMSTLFSGGKWMRLRYCFFALVALNAFAAAPEPNLVQSRTLENGLQVFLVRSPGPRTFQAAMALKAGSLEEANGASGAATLLARLMEQDLFTIEKELAKSSPPGVIAVPLAPYGWRPGQIRIQYEGLLFPSRVANSEFDAWCRTTVKLLSAPSPAKFNPTHQRLLLEQIAFKESADDRLADLLRSQAFTVGPYRRPVAGWPGESASLQQRDIESFRERCVTPTRTALVLVGNFTWEEVLPSLSQSFGQWLAPDVPARPIPPEPEQKGERRAILEADAPYPGFQVGWLIPGESHPDPSVMTMLSRILGMGRTSRLHRQLVDTNRLASRVDVRMDGSASGAILFSIGVIGNGDVNTGEIGAKVLQAIEQLQNQPPTPEEMNRVLALIELEEIRISDDPERLAMALARTWLETGSPADFLLRIKRL